MHWDLQVKLPTLWNKRCPGDNSYCRYSVDRIGVVLAKRVDVVGIESTVPLFGPQPATEAQFPVTQPAAVATAIQPQASPQITTAPTAALPESSLSTVPIASILAAHTSATISIRSGTIGTHTAAIFATSQVVSSAQSSFTGTVASKITISRDGVSASHSVTALTSSLSVSSSASVPSASSASLASTSTHLHSTNFYVGISFGIVAGLACLIAFISWLVRSRRRTSSFGDGGKYLDMEDHDNGPRAFPTMYERSIPRHSDGASRSRVNNVFPPERDVASKANPFVIPPPKPYSPFQSSSLPRNPNHFDRPASAYVRRSLTPTSIDQSLGKLKVQNLMPGDISSAEESCAPVLKRDLSALGFIELPRPTAVINDISQPAETAAKASHIKPDYDTETPLAQALVQCAIAAASTPPPMPSSGIPLSLTPGPISGKNVNPPFARDLTTPRLYQAPTHKVSSPCDATPLPAIGPSTNARLSLPTPQFTNFSQLGIGASPGRLKSENGENGSAELEGWGATLRNSIMTTLSAMTGTGRLASAAQEQDAYTSLPSRSSMREVSLASTSNSNERKSTDTRKVHDLELGYRDTTRSGAHQARSATEPLNVRKRNTTGGMRQSAAHLPAHQGRDMNTRMAGQSIGDIELPHFSTLHPNITVRRPRKRNVSAPVSAPKPALRKGTNTARPVNLRRVSSTATGRSSTPFSSASSPSGEEMTEGEAGAKRAMIMRKARRRNARVTSLGVQTSEKRSANIRSSQQQHPARPGQVLRKQNAANL